MSDDNREKLTCPVCGAEEADWYLVTIGQNEMGDDENQLQLRCNYCGAVLKRDDDVAWLTRDE